jgi:hypothetical protein
MVVGIGRMIGREIFYSLGSEVYEAYIVAALSVCLSSSQLDIGLRKILKILIWMTQEK